VASRCTPWLAMSGQWRHASMDCQTTRLEANSLSARTVSRFGQVIIAWARQVRCRSMAQGID
jgi:hypothetical protein